MNIEYALGKMLHKPGREQAHVAGEAHEVNSVLLQCCYNFSIVILAFFALGRNYARRQSKLPCSFDPSCVRLVRDYYCNAGIWNFSRCDVLRDSFEVRATT